MSYDFLNVVLESVVRRAGLNTKHYLLLEYTDFINIITFSIMEVEVHKRHLC